jgi:hypothetical protein
MKPLRRVCSLAIFVFAILMIVLVAAQSNPTTHAHQPDALPDSQRLSAGAFAQLDPAAEAPPMKFSGAVNYYAGPYPASVAIADVNGDGHPDLVVADNGSIGGGSSYVSVLLGDGDGTFQPAVTYAAGGLGAVSLAVADVNGDGRPDLVVAILWSSSVVVLLGNGDGTFRAPVTYSSGGYEAESVAIGDVNGDGKPDLLVANLCAEGGCGNGSVTLLLGNGDGTFQSPLSYSSGGYEAESIAIGDVNGDGKPDLVVANRCSSYGNCFGAVGVLLGNGDGTFQTPVSYSVGGYDPDYSLPVSVAIGDLNGDGYPDLVVTNQCKSDCGDGFGPDGVSVLLGNGDGTFQDPVSYSSGGVQATSVAIGDVNGDGKPDLVVANWCEHVGCKGAADGSASVLLGNGDGTFQAPINYAVFGHGYASKYYEPYSVVIGDVNGDGRADLVTANAFSATVGVLLNKLTVTTTTEVISSPNPSQVNQSATFTATVSSSSMVPNGSTVTFNNGATKVGTAATIDGVASLTTSFSKAKTYTIKASYPGDPFHRASSGTVKQVVSP